MIGLQFFFACLCGTASRARCRTVFFWTGGVGKTKMPRRSTAKRGNQLAAMFQMIEGSDSGQKLRKLARRATQSERDEALLHAAELGADQCAGWPSSQAGRPTIPSRCWYRRGPA